MSETEALFPDFQQELAQRAQQSLAQRIGQLFLSDNAANVAAEIYSGRLQRVEALYFQGQEKLVEFEATLAELRARVDAFTAEDTERLPQDAEPIVDFRLPVGAV